jgi:hypothetical protein
MSPRERGSACPDCGGLVCEACRADIAGAAAGRPFPRPPELFDAARAEDCRAWRRRRRGAP